MLENFKYSNPTKLYFGEDWLKALREELDGYKVLTHAEAVEILRKSIK